MVWRLPSISNRMGIRKGAGIWRFFLVLLFLVLGITTRSPAAAKRITPEDWSCSAPQTCEGSDCDEPEEYCQEPSPVANPIDKNDNEASVEDSCAVDARNGMCALPEEMFEKCPPHDYCRNREDFGAVILVPPTNTSEDCEDFEDDCELMAEENQCLLDPTHMLSECPKSCYMCFGNDADSSNDKTHNFVEVSIGVRQVMSPGKKVEANKKRFYEVIAETAAYMTNEVFAKEKFESARRDCINYSQFCAWKVASTDGEYCEEDESTQLCGPACQACEYMILTDDEMDTFEDCLEDKETNVFEEAKGDGEQGGEESEGNVDRTVDAMFRRIVGELPYPSIDEEPYPIVPGVNYTVKVLSRPSPNPEIHTNMPLNSIDFYIGGPWIVVLDDFLTPEECDRMIELGDLIGREKSEIDDDEEQNDDDQYDDDQYQWDKEADGDKSGEKKKVTEEKNVDGEEKEWRTSTTAWCNEEICGTDPVAIAIQERIGLTTGVTDESYYEHFQLLKYKPGQYYMHHHDESDDHHEKLHNPSGPRILTFFLYLNDVEEGGETRFTDLMGDESNVYIDVKPKKGRALLWPSMTNEDLLMLEERTFHAALEVKKGLKYGANAWLHLRDVRNDNCNEEALEDLREKWDLSYYRKIKTPKEVWEEGN